MIGGGGKIGGGPVGPKVGSAGEPEPVQKQKGPEAPRAERDQFQRGAARAAGESGVPAKLTRESSGSTDVLRLARDNPAGARQLVATMAQQAAATMSQIGAEMAAARNVLAQLGAQKFSEKALTDKGRELRKHRDRLAAMKMRLHLGQRKMALLQQIAGKLGDPRLDQELDRLLSHHKKLKTEWGRRHHLLSIADSLYDGDDATPEHLQEVVRAEVRSGSRGQSVADAMHEISPRRVIAELIARTLDGTLPEPQEAAELGRRGEHGRTLQSWAAVRDIMVDSLASDPLDPED